MPRPRMPALCALLAAAALAGTGSARAQVPADPDSQLVWVWLADKGVPPSGMNRALQQAAAALSPRSLQRRSVRGTVRGVDGADLPVPPEYVAALRDLGLRVRHRSRWLNAVSGRVHTRDLVGLRALPFVREVSPLARAAPRGPIPIGPPPARSPLAPPGASFYGVTWEQNTLHQVPLLHDEGFTGAGVLIGILDTGFITSHRVFRDLEVVGQFDAVANDSTVSFEPGDFSGSSRHGTLVWSAMAGYWEGELVGIAYGASFLLARTEVVGSETQVEEDNWIAAMEWMEGRGVDVTNTSLGYAAWYGYQDMDGDTAPITVAADMAAARGVVIITSAGNEGSRPPPATPDEVDFGYYIAAPADGDSVIAVGGTDDSGQLWSDSSRGPTWDGRIKPDLLARAAAVACAVPGTGDSTLGSASGTSLAAPLVTGVAALLLEAHPEWTPMQVRDALRETADRSFNAMPGIPDNDYGWGVLRGFEAHQYGSAPPPVSSGVGVHNYPNPFSDQTTFVLQLHGAGSGRLRIFTSAGAPVRSFDVVAGYETTLSILWDGRNSNALRVAPGVYWAVLDYEGRRASTRVLVVR